MTSSSVPSATSSNRTLAELRQSLREDMVACRQSTLSLVQTLTAMELRQQAHADFSPIGWHLGHIAFTESLWLLEHLKEEPCPYPHYQTLFAADGLPKAERENLPSLPEILEFLQAVRDRTLAYLDTAPLYDQLRLWRWLLQHESQHAETATYILAMHRRSSASRQSSVQAAEVSLAASSKLPNRERMVLIPAGRFEMGSDILDALDNERPPCTVRLEDYWIDRVPVTVADYSVFIAAGGYQNSQWWHPQGWQWLQKQAITHPLYWYDSPETVDKPVCGVSWYEADAYACFVGKRLPTEAEWEYAARWNPAERQLQTYPWGEALPTSTRANFGAVRAGVTTVGQFPEGRSATGCADMLGNVWEWTDTWFDRYEGFTPYPYIGYSQAYFDRAHRVLRGGSWATRQWVLRPSFRNWYQPDVRQIFAGFRCALAA